MSGLTHFPFERDEQPCGALSAGPAQPSLALSSEPHLGPVSRLSLAKRPMSCTLQHPAVKPQVAPHLPHRQHLAGWPPPPTVQPPGPPSHLTGCSLPDSSAGCFSCLLTPGQQVPAAWSWIFSLYVQHSLRWRTHPETPASAGDSQIYIPSRDLPAKLNLQTQLITHWASHMSRFQNRIPDLQPSFPPNLLLSQSFWIDNGELCSQLHRPNPGVTLASSLFPTCPHTSFTITSPSAPPTKLTRNGTSFQYLRCCHCAATEPLPPSLCCTTPSEGVCIDERERERCEK